MLGMDPTLAENRRRWGWQPEGTCPTCRKRHGALITETHEHRQLDCLDSAGLMARARMTFLRRVRTAAGRMQALSGPMPARGSTSGHTRRYLDRISGLSAAGKFSARNIARDDILRLCSGLIPHELRRCLLLDGPDQRAGLRFIR